MEIAFKNIRNLLVLGATSDIGITTAMEFAREGFAVTLAGLDLPFLERAAADIAIRQNVEAKAVFFDATNYPSHAAFYQAIEPKPDVCLCVFGYLGDQATAERDWDESVRIIEINYKAAISILNVVAADFIARKSGTIIGVSSVAGDRGRQSNFIYGSAKAGFTAYLSGLRNKLFHHGGHVITVKPGFVDTRMTEHLELPASLTAQPDQVGAAIYTAYEKKRDIIYVLPAWRFIMLVITTIPEFIFKRIRL